MHRRHHVAASLVGALALAGCGAESPPTSDTNLAVSVGALALPGVDEACYTITVKNGDTPPATVWTRTDLCSTQYGDGTGAIAYVGTCDAQFPAQTVELTLTSLSANGVGLVHPSDYVNPTAHGPIVLPATCRPNQDSPVRFDLTIMRSAVQGFFDVAVDFRDIFCSAKLDCDVGPLLFDPVTGKPIPTAVAALACTAGPAADTHLYLSSVALDCGGVAYPVPLVGAPGNIYSALSPAPGPLAQVATYQGAEALTNPDGTPLRKLYFNVAMALDAATAATCSLSFTATASDGGLTDCDTPVGSVYPVIHFDAPSFIDNGAFACGKSGLDIAPGVGVWTDYVRPPVQGHFNVEASASPSGVGLAVTSCGFCGDGVRDPALEACDPPSGTTACAYGEASCQLCSDSCQTISGTPVGACDDGVVQLGFEDCDPPSDTTSCAYGEASCELCSDACETFTGSVIGTCGDDAVQAGFEDCDPPSGTTACAYGEPSCQRCSADCHTVSGTVTGYCGDGVVQSPSEGCDPPSGSLDCAPGVTSCTVCSATCQSIPGNPGPPVTPIQLTNGAPSGCVAQNGTSEHCIVATVSCDDTCEVWVDGVKYVDFDESSPWWNRKTIVLGGITSGCHVLGVRTKDVFNIAAGFVGTIAIDGAQPGDEHYYVTAQTDAITVSPTAPDDGAGNNWSTFAYQTTFPTAVQCTAIDTWNAAPWLTWGTQYYGMGAFPIWYNSQCAGDHTEAYARIVFTVPEDGTMCRVPGGGEGGGPNAGSTGIEVTTDGTTYTPIGVPVCGNGAREVGEQCDPPNAPSSTCAYGQTCQGCSSTCQDVFVTGPRCGDGIKNGPEVCEGADVPTCASLDASKPFGTVTCSGSCTPITTSCSADPCFGKPTLYTGNLVYTSGAGRNTPAGLDVSCLTQINGRLVAKPPYDGTLPTWAFTKLTTVNGQPVTSGATILEYVIDLDNPPAGFGATTLASANSSVLRVKNIVSPNLTLQAQSLGVFENLEGGTINFHPNFVATLWVTDNHGTTFNVTFSGSGSGLKATGNGALGSTPTTINAVGPNAARVGGAWAINNNPRLTMTVPIAIDTSFAYSGSLQIDGNAAATRIMLSGGVNTYAFTVTNNLFSSSNLSLPAIDLYNPSGGNGFFDNPNLSTCWITSYIATLIPSTSSQLGYSGNLACP